MKPFITILTTLILLTSLGVQAQSDRKQTRSSRHESSYQRKTARHQVKSADSSDLNAILKDSSNAETGPILNDNGNVNSTGAIDGSRSSTGRPDADTTYTIKRKKTVIRSGYNTPRDTTGRRRKP
ncbi:hypothetical protein [Dyadobacter sp. 676]|uniref:Uncharacterized protein n=1 Tax=Dyadobacter sp. 676 TaxID=3088362 RepID=A0AAU8FLI1_9BACT